MEFSHKTHLLEVQSTRPTETSWTASNVKTSMENPCKEQNYRDGKKMRAHLKLTGHFLSYELLANERGGSPQC